MKLYNFYIFNRSGDCLYYKEWSRPQNTLHDDPAEEKKLVFGMLFSLKDFTHKLSPRAESEELRMVKTKAFCLHHYESVTGLMFVLNSDTDTPSQYARLEHLYKNVYIDYVARSPLYDSRSGKQIQSQIFSTKVEKYLHAETTKT
jgi:hypothetical protein